MMKSMELILGAALCLVLWVVGTHSLAAISGQRVPFRALTGPGILTPWWGPRLASAQHAGIAVVPQAAMAYALAIARDSAQSMVCGVELVAAATWLAILLRYVLTHRSGSG
jgi:hypothetical protein